jgi:pimeloyl-ACP methyl ester carboxylesterase
MKVVLLPGLDGTGILFRPLLECFSPDLHAQVVALPHDRALGYPELVSLVRDQLPTSEPFVLLGESFSGPLSLFLAALQPRNLSGVVLCASFVSNPTFFPVSASRLTGSWLFQFTPAFVQAKALLGGYSSSTLRALLAQAHGEVRPEVMAARIRSVLTVNAREALSSLSVPLAYLRGTRDFVVPSRNLRAVQALCPRVQVFSILAPHLVLQVAPEASARAIEAFVATLSANTIGPKSTTGGAA